MKFTEKGITHILTLSFDDGFKRSFYTIADIHEDVGLKACLNVIASGHLPGFKQVDDWILPELMGDFDDWNRLKERGHEVMPHSWKHLNLGKKSFGRSKRLIDKCLAYFEANLEGYKNSEAVFNFPFNSSTPALEEYLLTKVKAIRSRANTTYNMIPDNDQSVRLGCYSNGPNNIDGWVEKTTRDFLHDPQGGWLILNLHGLENEGWGPISTDFLKRFLKEMVKVDYLEIMPAGEVLKMGV